MLSTGLTLKALFVEQEHTVKTKSQTDLSSPLTGPALKFIREIQI